MIRLKEDIKCCSYHEAGHAAIYYLFGINISLIEVSPRDGKVHAKMYSPTAGAYRWLFELKNTLHEENRNILYFNLKKYAMICLSGYISEYKFLNKPLPFGIQGCASNPENDYSRILKEMDRANSLLNTYRYNSMTFYHFEVSIRRLVLSKIVWEAISALANRLIEQNILYGNEVEIILSTYLDKKRQVFKLT